MPPSKIIRLSALLPAWALLFTLAAAAHTYNVLDVQSVRINGDPNQWVRAVTAPAEPETFTCDILIAGTDGGDGVTSANDEVGVEAGGGGHLRQADDVERAGVALSADERGRVGLLAEDVDGHLIVTVEVGGLADAGAGHGVAGGEVGLDDLDVEDDLGPLGLGRDGQGGCDGEQS